MKSPAMLPPRNYPIKNQDTTRIITQQDPILTPLLEKGPTGHTPFIDDKKVSNKTEDENNYFTENSRTDNKNSVNKINIDKDGDKDDE